MLKKEEVYVRVSSEKKARKLKELLEMFNEPTGSQTFELVKNGGDVYYNTVGNCWCTSISRPLDDKTKVSLKELRNILAVEHESTKKELEVGKWYRHTSGSLANYQGKDKSMYGLTVFGSEDGLTMWIDKDWIIKCSNGSWQEATPQEVEEALIKEAKRRGLFGGVKISPLIQSFNNHYTLDGDYANYYEDKNRLFIGSILVFKDGKWAEVIQEPKSLEERVKELEQKVKQLENR